MDDAVVVHDPEFVLGKEDREEEVEVLFPGPAGVLFPSELSDPDGGGAAVMAVGDVDAVDAGKGPADLFTVIGIRDDPDLVADLSLGHKIGGGSGCCHTADDGADDVI